MKPIILIDMDDTIAAFIGDKRLFEVPIIPEFKNYEPMHLPGFFRELEPLDGAIEAVKRLIESNLFDVHICSTPLATSPHSYSEKVEWIKEHVPELLKKIILTQDKTMLKADYLIDDSLHWKEKWENTERQFIHFNPRKPSLAQWEAIVEKLLKTHGK